MAITRAETACPLDCPDSCSLIVETENGRLVKIDGSRRSPFTEGYICAKVRAFGEHVYGDARVLHPLIRSGRRGSGDFRRASWDEALSLVATRMLEARDTWGAESILPFYYGGSNGPITQETYDARLFGRFGASQLRRTVCAAPTSTAATALYGNMGGVSMLDYAEAKLILLWGANPNATGIHHVAHIREAQKRGGLLVVVDPRSTPLARLADLHLAVRPGTDVVVALALHRYLFEKGFADISFLESHATGASRLRAKALPWEIDRAADIAGIDSSALEICAEWYATMSPAVVRCGWGLERNRNGGNAAMAILALPAVGGKFGIRGGGYTTSNSGVWPVSAAKDRWREPSTARWINMNHLGRALEGEVDPPVKMLFVYNCNPVATMPDQNRVLRGLARDDLFTVVFDQVMTDSAMMADVVLPATTFLESHDLARGYGAFSLQVVEPVIDRVGESRSNSEVFGELCDRLGLVSDGTSRHAGATLETFVGDLPERIQIDLRERGLATPDFGARPIQFVDVFPATPTGRVELFDAALDAEAPAGLYVYQSDPASAEYPLALISPASSRTVSSTLGQLRTRPARVEIHVDDARARGIRDDDEVRVFNTLGEIRCRAAVTDRTRPGTLSLPKGLWRRDTANGSTSNALSPDSLTDLGGGACFNDARVEIEVAQPAEIG